MGEYRLDNSWKAWRSRMKHGFRDSGAGITLGFAPVWAVFVGFIMGSVDYGICTLIGLAWFAGIETFAGARVIRKTDERFVGVLNAAQEGGAA